MIGLRSEHQIHDRRPAQHFLALGLCDAAGHAEEKLPPFRGRRLLEGTQAAQLRIDLLARLFANMAGVQDNEIGVAGILGLGVAQGRQCIGHTNGVVDVHLAAVGLDVEFLGHGSGYLQSGKRRK